MCNSWAFTPEDFASLAASAALAVVVGILLGSLLVCLGRVLLDVWHDRLLERLERLETDTAVRRVRAGAEEEVPF